MVASSQGKFKVSEISQVAIVVRDLQKTMEHYWNTLGIGPWQIYTVEPPFLHDTKYRGKPGQFKMKIALAMVGSLNVELIQPLEGAHGIAREVANLGDPIDGGADRARAVFGALRDLLGQLRRAANVLAHFLDGPVHLGDRGGGLLGDLLHGIAALGDPVDVLAHLMN